MLTHSHYYEIFLKHFISVLFLLKNKILITHTFMFTIYEIHLLTDTNTHTHTYTRFQAYAHLENIKRKQIVAINISPRAAERYMKKIYFYNVVGARNNLLLKQTIICTIYRATLETINLFLFFENENFLMSFRVVMRY